MTHIKKELYAQEAVLLDIKTAVNFIKVLTDLKIAKSSEQKIILPKTLEKFQYSQVMSTVRFSAGQHY